MPPIPTWEGLHPLVVHFPIALLAAAPILIVVGLLARSWERPFLLSALIVMALGTGGAWLAVASGTAAGQLAERLPGVDALLEHHEEMAETTRTLFTVLTLVFATMVIAPSALKREPSGGVRLWAYASLLAAYTGALVYLANTAHQGGRLVHEKGVRALVVGGGSGPPANAPESRAPIAEQRDGD